MTFINTDCIFHPLSLRKSREKLGLTLAFGALIFGGTYGALAKGLTNYLSPISLLLCSEALTALFVILTLGIVPIFRAIARMDVRTFLCAALVGILNSAIAPWLWFTGLKYSTAVNASILSGSDILFSLLLCSLLLKERITRMQGVGAAVVFVGVLVISIGAGPEALSVHMGDALIFLGVGVFAFGAILFKKYLTHVSAEVALLIRNFTGIFCILAISLLIHHPFIAEISAFPIHKVLLLLAFAFFARYVHLMCYYESVDRLPATTVALINNAQPLAGIIFAVLILGESLHLYHILGVVFILFGLVLEQMSSETLAHLQDGTLRFRLGRHH